MMENTFWIERGQLEYSNIYFLVRTKRKIDFSLKFGYILGSEACFCEECFEEITGIKMEPGEQREFGLTEVSST